jgi:hypothetical protein
MLLGVICCILCFQGTQGLVTLGRGEVSSQGGKLWQEEQVPNDRAHER